MLYYFIMRNGSPRFCPRFNPRNGALAARQCPNSRFGQRANAPNHALTLFQCPKWAIEKRDLVF